MRYTSIWRNKWLTANAKSFAEMAQTLENAARELRQMAADGVALETHGMGDDYAFLSTEDKAVAEKYGFHEGEEEDLETEQERAA